MNTQAAEKRWPVGKERLKVGEINSTRPLTVRIEFEDIDEVDSLHLTMFGEDGQSVTRRIPCKEEFDLQLSDEDQELSEKINASIYIISAKLTDGTSRIVSKGRVNWQTGTRK